MTLDRGDDFGIATHLGKNKLPQSTKLAYLEPVTEKKKRPESEKGPETELKEHLEEGVEWRHRKKREQCLGKLGDDAREDRRQEDERVLTEELRIVPFLYLLAEGEEEKQKIRYAPKRERHRERVGAVSW